MRISGKMKRDLFPWNGSMRLRSSIYYKEVVWTPEDFLAECTIDGVDPSKTLNQLQSVDMASNITLTPGAIYYHENVLIVTEVVERAAGPSVEPMRLDDEKILLALEEKLGRKLGFSHSHDLRHGRVCLVDLLKGVSGSAYTLGKRLKGFGGHKTVGKHPLPETVAEVTTQEPDGVIYFSRAYAKKFELSTGFGKGVSGVMPADKVGGVIPIGNDGKGILVKGSVEIRDDIDVDILVPRDALKVRNVPFNKYTRFYIKTRAHNRIGSKPTRISYQAGQFHPLVIAKMVREKLCEPWRSDTMFNWYEMIAGRAPKREYIDLLSWEIEDTGRRYHPVVDLITGTDDELPAAPDFDRKEWLENKVVPARGALEQGVGIDDSRVKRVVHRVLRGRMDDLVNPGVRGVWGVQMPYKGRRDTISLPVSLYYYLDCPDEVAAVRFPIKGKSSLLRLECEYHKDGYDIRIHPDLVRVVHNG